MIAQFSPKPFKKKFLHGLYYEKKIRTKLPTKKKNSCRGNFSTTPPGYLMVHPLGVAGKRNTDFVTFVTILPLFAAKRPD